MTCGMSGLGKLEDRAHVLRREPILLLLLHQDLFGVAFLLGYSYQVGSRSIVPSETTLRIDIFYRASHVYPGYIVYWLGFCSSGKGLLSTDSPILQLPAYDDLLVKCFLRYRAIIEKWQRLQICWISIQPSPCRTRRRSRCGFHLCKHYMGNFRRWRLRLLAEMNQISFQSSTNYLYALAFESSLIGKTCHTARRPTCGLDGDMHWSWPMKWCKIGR